MRAGGRGGSTKTLTASMTALYILACHIGRVRGAIDDARMSELIGELAQMPGPHRAGARSSSRIASIAEACREPELPLPGARLRVPDGDGGRAEAEGGELHPCRGLSRRRDEAWADRAHRPSMPVVAIALDDGTRDKMLSNIEQVRARNGIVIGVITEGDDELAGKCDHVWSCRRYEPLLYRCSRRSRCSCSRITSRRGAAATSTSLVTSPRL